MIFDDSLEAVDSQTDYEISLRAEGTYERQTFILIFNRSASLMGG